MSDAAHAEMKAMPLSVDIASDVVCPWCIIGYKQLQRALAELPGRFDVSLEWHPFELNPQMPAEGQNLREHVAQKYGTSVSGSQRAREQLTALGAELGFTFNYSDDMRMVNTFAAHQLLHWARIEGCQTDLKLALFAAFFTEGKDVSDHTVLARVAAEVGLSETEAADVLSTQRYAADVRAEEQHWMDRDVHAVPAFLFNDKYLVPGAQSAETFVRLLEKIAVKEAAREAQA